MNKNKGMYETPCAWIVSMAATEALLAASAGATLPGVDEVVIENVF